MMWVLLLFMPILQMKMLRLREGREVTLRTEPVSEAGFKPRILNLESEPLGQTLSKAKITVGADYVNICF